jgi:hypothetical protein
MSGHYPEAIVKAFREGRAWKFSTMGFAGLSTILVLSLAYLAAHETVVLVPYAVATAKGHVKVSPASNGAVNGAYLSYVAEADIGLILNWTPQDIKEQYQRFLNRLTPELFTQEQSRLLAAANLNKKRDMSEAFYVQQISYVGDTVHLSGVLDQWQGNTLLSANAVTYDLTYHISEGMPYVANISIVKTH